MSLSSYAATLYSPYYGKKSRSVNGKALDFGSFQARIAELGAVEEHAGGRRRAAGGVNKGARDPRGFRMLPALACGYGEARALISRNLVAWIADLKRQGARDPLLHAGRWARIAELDR